MDFSELARSRYSVRQFSEQPVPRETLDKILEAGRLAPTACNLQPQHVYVLQSQAALDAIRAITPCAFNAPVVLLVCGDTKTCWTNPYRRAYVCRGGRLHRGGAYDAAGGRFGSWHHLGRLF